MKKFLAILIILISIIVMPFFVFAINESGGNSTEIDTLNKQIAEKQNKIKELEKSIEDYKNKISQKRSEAVSLKNQMAIIDNRVTELSLDVQATEEKIVALDLEIEALQLSIEDKEASLVKQKMILSGLIRSIYYQGDKNYLEIVATYDNFSDFYNQFQYLRTVQDSLGQSVRGLRVAKGELDLKRLKVTEQKLTYEKTKEELKQKRQNWEEQAGLKSNLLAQVQTSEMKYNTLLGSLRSQYQQIEGEISGIEKQVRKKLEAQKKIDDSGETETIFGWPVQSHYVTSNFHDPDYPYRNVFEHTGTDIRASQGTPVKAAASGYVAVAKVCSLASCYSYVMLVHSDGLATVYGHLSKIVVKADQFITRGDVIAYSGGTRGTVGAGPFVTGPHLHFEVRSNGIPVNPLNYLP